MQNTTPNQIAATSTEQGVKQQPTAGQLRRKEMFDMLHPEYQLAFKTLKELVDGGTNTDGRSSNHPFSKESWLKYLLTLQEVDATSGSGRHMINGYAVSDFEFLSIFKPLVKPAPVVFAHLTNRVDFIKRYEPQSAALEYIYTPVELVVQNKQLKSITGRAHWDNWSNSEVITLNGDTYRQAYGDFESMLVDATVNNKVKGPDVKSWFEVKTELIDISALDAGKWYDLDKVIIDHFK